MAAVIICSDFEAQKLLLADAFPSHEGIFYQDRFVDSCFNQ